MRNKSFRMYANGLEEAHFFRTAPRSRICCPRENFAIGGAKINFSGCSVGINNLSYFQQLLRVIQVCNYYLALAREQRMEGQLKISSLSKVPTAAFCHRSLPSIPPGVNVWYMEVSSVPVGSLLAQLCPALPAAPLPSQFFPGALGVTAPHLAMHAGRALVAHSLYATSTFYIRTATVHTLKKKLQTRNPQISSCLEVRSTKPLIQPAQKLKHC